MNNLKRKLLINIVMWVTILVVLLDCLSVIFLQRPFFAIRDKNMYKGLLLTTHVCNGEKVNLFKWQKYECISASQDDHNYETIPEYSEPIVTNFDFSVNSDLTGPNLKKYIFMYDNIKYYYVHCFTIDIVVNKDKKKSFESAIKSNLISIEDVLEKRQQENFYYDGGSRIYKYSNFYIMVCKNKDNSKSIILGPNEHVTELCDW